MGGTRGIANAAAREETLREAPESLEQGLALPPPSNATACTSSAQCATGYCVDGYCCDAPCDNTCMACSAAKKGSGVDGVCGSVAYDTDPDNECPDAACDGKNVCKKYNGVTCSSTAQCLSNYCVDGYCCGNICMGACQACSTAKKGSGLNGVCGNIAVNADPDNECTGSDCNGSGACQTAQTTVANGSACTSAAQCASGYCADGVCCDSWCLGTCQACTAVKKGSGVDGTCGAIANDKDPDEECWGGSCDGKGVCKQYNGVPCASTGQCLSGYCVDGICCGNVCTGMCQACSAAKKGQGYDGVCGLIANGNDPENECSPGECNGSGACNQAQNLQANGATCASGGQCASSNCVEGICCDTACTGLCQACSAVKKGSGADGTCGNIKYDTDPDNECYGGSCSGGGTCQQYNGLSCTSTAECLSNYCVDGFCCNNVCTGSCQACSAAKKGQGADGSCGPIVNTTDPDNECNPGECNGASACNQSQTPQGNGAACVVAVQCLSGFCVDGVCCDNACSGTCQACSATKKGSGANGTCGSIKYDTDPDNECEVGGCSGSGICQFYNGVPCAGTAECLSNYCVDGFCCGNVCAGKCQSCSAAKKGSGYDGLCGPTANNSDPDNDCALMCDGTGACQKTPDGVACTEPSDCLSGNCVDGVCCDNACTSTCLACSAAKKGSGTDGSCGPIAVQTDPDNECPLGKCDGTGVCTVLSANGVQCSNDSECASDHCIDGVCCDTACTGSCVACNLSASVGTCSPIPYGQSDPNGTPPCNNSCDGNGSCGKSTGQACVTGSECAGRVCERLVCKAAQPGDDWLIWRTVWEMPPYWSGPFPELNFKNMVANDSGWTDIDGDTPCFDQTPCALTGGFSANGVPYPSHWDGSYAVYHSFWRFIAKTGPFASESYYQKTTLQGCLGNWYDGYSTYIAGNRAGRTVHIAQSCDWGSGGNGTDFGDGNSQYGPVFVRRMASGPNQVTAIPANITKPMAYGPSSEVYSIALGGGLTIYKSPAGGAATTAKAIPGSINSRGFDVDLTGNLLIAFGFSGSVDFGAGAMTAAGSSLGLVKLDPNGNVVWQKQYPGSVNVDRLVAGENGFGVIASGAVNLGYGTTTGGFVARFDSAGTALWHAKPNGFKDTINSGAVFGAWSTLIEDNGSGAPLSKKFTITVEKYLQCAGGAKCKAQGAACTANDQCGSGFCTDGVCCDDACASTCAACTAAKKGFGVDGSCQNIASGNDPENECTAGACNGGGKCASDLSLACTTNANCLSGFCADGICCNEQCAGPCRACSTSLKGNGVDGQCGDIAAGTDPQAECAGGTCSGSGACSMAGNGAACVNGSACLSTFCVDGVCCDNACGNLCQACTAAKKGSGSDGVCGPVKTNTDPDNECANGNCNAAGECIFGNGSACTIDANCYSGHCVDGVCCDQACTGTCVACTAAKTGFAVDGACRYIPNGTDPDAECNGQSCNGGGACWYGNGDSCSKSSQCLSGNCMDGVCCDSVCSGHCMACTAAKTGLANGVCGTFSAGTDPEGECIGSTCGVGGVCAPISCSTSSDCPTGLCANGTCGGFLQAGANGQSSCAVFLDGKIKCWGYGANLGLGTTSHRGDQPNEMGANLPFVNIGTGRFAKKIAMGYNHFCPILHDGTVTCWGNNDSGKLGRGDTASFIGNTPGSMGDNLVLVNLGAGRVVVDVAISLRHACALLSDGNVKCWGDNALGQLGLGDTLARGTSPGGMGDNLPVVNLGTGRTATSIAVGDYATCVVLDNGTVKCWGYNASGQLGLGDTVNRGSAPGQMGDNLPPVDLGMGKIAVEVSMNYSHACARLNDGSVKCWGTNSAGQLGVGDNVNRGSGPGQMGDNLPAVNLGTGKTATHISAGGDFTCALLNDKTVKCWGMNANGENGAGFVANLGDGPGEMGDNLVPVNLGTGKTVLRLATGIGHSCVIFTDGSVKCWGANGFGQLGIGSYANRGTQASGMGDNLPVVQLY